MKNIVKQIKFFIEYIIVLLLFFFLSLLPLNFVSILGNIVFRLLGPLSRSHKITLLNLKKIFSSLREDDIKKIARKSWGNLGKTVFELSILKKLVDRKNNKISLYGLENINLKGQNITAFAGIAYPEKFFISLEEQGGKIVKQITYPDHYIYTENDLLTLAETANKTKSILVSTQKDNVRIPKAYRSLVNTLEGEIVFENEDLLIKILTNVVKNYF